MSQHSLRNYLFLIIAASVPYLNALANGFTYDDHPQILDNAVIQGPDWIGTFAAPLYPGVLYRPLTVFSFALNQTFTPTTAAFHATNIALHVAVTLLVAWLAQHLFRRPLLSLIAATVFAVHPIHTEAVSSLVGRAEELAAIGTLGALYATSRSYQSRSSAGRMLWFVLAVASFCLGILSKESAITALPLLILFHARSQRLGVTRTVLRLEWLPYLACTLVFFWLRYNATEMISASPGAQPLNNVLTLLPASGRIASALGVIFDELSQLIFPLVLSADYSHAQTPIVLSWLEPRCLAGAAALAALCIAAKSFPRPLGFCAFFVLVTLSVTSNLLIPTWTVRAERLLYLPSVGLALLIGLLFDTLLQRQKAPALIWALLALWLSGLAVRTWVRNEDWRDDYTLYCKTAQTSPFSAKAHANCGVVLQQRGEHIAAIAQLKRALELYPRHTNAAHALAFSLEHIGATVDADSWYRRAIETDPYFLKAHIDLCRMRLAAEHYAESQSACRAGLRYAASNPDLIKGLGASLIGLGKVGEGYDLLQRSLRLNPSDNELRRFLDQRHSS